jgi:hypothetical protein
MDATHTYACMHAHTHAHTHNLVNNYVHFQSQEQSYMPYTFITLQLSLIHQDMCLPISKLFFGEQSAGCKVVNVTSYPCSLATLALSLSIYSIHCFPETWIK